MSALTGNTLGDYLRAARSRLEAGDVGLPTGGARRVAGLRREEVAVLAGVSADYYARLEQGRERRPSPQMIGALARALRLDHDATAHLHRVAGLSPGMAADTGREHVDPALLVLLESFPASAAYVLSPSFDVLATNPIATALLAPFAGNQNMVRVLFTDPHSRTVFAEWPQVSRATVHALRLHAGEYPDDPGIRQLVADMTRASSDFRALWEENTVASLARAFKVFVDPDLGRIELVSDLRRPRRARPATPRRYGHARQPERRSAGNPGRPPRRADSTLKAGRSLEAHFERSRMPRA
ncbi:helix-turn-helix transcriptional regulator [Frondihabitans cladoniiphilus]